jgi:hypothetical protein
MSLPEGYHIAVTREDRRIVVNGGRQVVDWIETGQRLLRWLSTMSRDDGRIIRP